MRGGHPHTVNKVLYRLEYFHHVALDYGTYLLYTMLD